MKIFATNRTEKRERVRALPKLLIAGLVLFLSLPSSAQNSSTSTQGETRKVDQNEITRLAQEAEKKRKELIAAERQGLEVRIKEIARFRGVRRNQLTGVGLVVGLNGTGDSKNTPYTQTLLSNAMKARRFEAAPDALKVKNVAVVYVTADLPPFAAPGNDIEVTVASLGDAKSLQGGELLQMPLYAGEGEIAYVVAQGPVSIGGFQVQAGGNTAQKNHPTAGKAPGIVEARVPTKTVFEGNKMFLELDDADATTAKRIAGVLAAKFPDYLPRANDSGSVEITLPEGRSPMIAMSEIEQTMVFSDNEGSIVIDERTGTIVAGANVRLGPAVIAKGGLSVQIMQTPLVSQPSPFSQGGNTATATQTNVSVEDAQAQVALVGPNATLGDLAAIFQILKVSPSDIIAIVQALHDQGALKAKIKRRG